MREEDRVNTPQNNNQSPSVATFGIGHLAEALTAKNLSTGFSGTELQSPDRNQMDDKQISEEMSSFQILGPLNIS